MEDGKVEDYLFGKGGRPVGPRLDERLDAIAWGHFDTAYGSAVRVPDQLRRLAGPDEKASLAASHELWCGLCHDHAYVSSAALPALPFLLEVLDRAGEQLTVEILDIFLGFASCTNPGFETAPPPWMAELRSLMAVERPRLGRLAAHPNSEIADFAKAVLQELESPSWC
jgi:hypothetical protein